MKLLDFIFAARPLLHLPVWSIYLVSLHYHLQLSGEKFGWTDLMVMVCLSFLVGGAYFINQIFDYESDRLNKKLGFLQRGYLSQADMWGACLLGSVLPLAVVAAVWPMLLFIFCQQMLIGFVYSVPPFRLKDRPWLGLFANAYTFGWLIPMTVMPGLNAHNAGLLGWDSPAYFFLSVAAIHLLTTLPDRKGDAATGKRTMGTIYNYLTLRLMALLIILATIPIAYYSKQAELVYLSIITSTAIFMALLTRSKRMDLLATKLPILLLTLLAGYYFVGYLLFVVVLLFLTRLYYVRRFGQVYPRLA